MNVTLSILFSLFVSWIWIDYLRRIDLLERERNHHLILVFIAGAVFPFLIDALHYYVIAHSEVRLDGNFINDFIYSVLVIGLVEEVVKFLPLLLMILFFKKALNEPIDYLVFAAVSALGFAFHENVQYINEYGIGVIGTRSVLSVPCHMFDSALFAYGFVLYRFHPAKNKLSTISLFIGLSALSHGFYDFWLLYDGIPGGIVITILYYFITISLFANVIGNCLNNSPFYNPKYIINSEKVQRLLFINYGILFLALLVVLTINAGIEEATTFYLRFAFLRFFILAILIIRLSRFKIVPTRWNIMKFEFPFSITFPGNRPGLQMPSIYQPRTMFLASFVHVRIKGESFNEAHINAFYEEHFEIHPISLRKSFLQKKRTAFMEQKLFLFNDEIFYLVRVYINNTEDDDARYFLLKAKSKGQTRMDDRFPLAALVKVNDITQLSSPTFSNTELKFMEWVMLKPIVGGRV